MTTPSPTVTVITPPNAAQQIMGALYTGKIGPQEGVKKPKEKSECWTELEQMYQSCAKLLLSHIELIRAVNDPALVAEVKDRNMLVANLKMLRDDMTKYSSELNQLHGFHKDKKGATDDPDELMHSIHLFEQYQLWMTRHEAVIMPVTAHVVEQIQEAELALANKAMSAQAERLLLDPSVVSDVEVKEPKPTEPEVQG